MESGSDRRAFGANASTHEPKKRGPHSKLHFDDASKSTKRRRVDTFNNSVHDLAQVFGEGSKVTLVTVQKPDGSTITIRMPTPESRRMDYAPKYMKQRATDIAELLEFEAEEEDTEPDIDLEIPRALPDELTGEHNGEFNFVLIDSETEDDAAAENDALGIKFSGVYLTVPVDNEVDGGALVMVQATTAPPAIGTSTDGRRQAMASLVERDVRTYNSERQHDRIISIMDQSFVGGRQYKSLYSGMEAMVQPSLIQRTKAKKTAIMNQIVPIHEWISRKRCR
jgi:hypothetical protein